MRNKLTLPASILCPPGVCLFHFFSLQKLQEVPCPVDYRQDQMDILLRIQNLFDNRFASTLKEQHW
jgi:hypothetical protein